MQKIRSEILIAVVLFIFLFPRDVYSNNKIKTIVVIFSLNSNLPAYQNMLDGFRSNFSNVPSEPCNVLVEYLDIGRSSNEDYAKNIVDLYNHKYKENAIDLLIAVGPMAYQVLAKYGLNALKNTPVISIENENVLTDSIYHQPDKNTLDIIIKHNIQGTLKAAFELFPQNKNVYIISGSSLIDNYYTFLTTNDTKAFKNTHRFTFISGVSLDSTLQIVKKIPSNSIVVIPTFMTDNNNHPFSTPEAIGIISNYCNAPVFPIFDSFIRTKGGIGGYVLSFVNIGIESGRIAQEILNGKPPQDITVNKSSFYQFVYDWKQIKRWNLSKSKAIPAESKFYNREDSFIGEYKWQILFVFLILISESFLIIYLFKLNRRQKDIVRQKTETESLFRELVREDRLSTMVEMTASISHELNQPLTAILYSAQAGKRFLDSEKLDPGQAMEIFDNIIEDDKRAAELISSVKSMMKLENREKEEVNVSTLIRETVSIFNSEAIRQNIHLIINFLDNPVFVFGDKIQLQQVLLNFISNAALSMEGIYPENKIIELKQRLNKDTITISVCDNGPGIDDSVKENLFKPFITSRKSGFGIGLAVSRSIIEKHNGTIWAENARGGGASFSFQLQVCKNER